MQLNMDLKPFTVKSQPNEAMILTVMKAIFSNKIIAWRSMKNAVLQQGLNL